VFVNDDILVWSTGLWSTYVTWIKTKWIYLLLDLL